MFQWRKLLRKEQKSSKVEAEWFTSKTFLVWHSKKSRQKVNLTLFFLRSNTKKITKILLLWEKKIVLLYLDAAALHLTNVKWGWGREWGWGSWGERGRERKPIGKRRRARLMKLRLATHFSLSSETGFEPELLFQKSASKIVDVKVWL